MNNFTSGAIPRGRIKQHAFDFLRALVSTLLSNHQLTPRQVAVEAILIDLLAYTENRIDEAALDRSVAAFKEYKARILE